MHTDAQSAKPGFTAHRMPGHIGNCLHPGCVIGIEHTPRMAPRFTPWRLWGQRSCYNGDEGRIYTEIDRCRATHADHHIRLNIEDFSCHSRFSFVVYSPAAGT